MILGHAFPINDLTYWAH